MLNRYNFDPNKVDEKFKVTLDKVLDEKVDEFEARKLIPFSSASDGMDIATDVIIYREWAGKFKAIVSDELINDIPFVNTGEEKNNARTFVITSGYKFTVQDIQLIASGKKDPEREIRTAVNSVADRENDLLLYGDDVLGGRIGLFTVEGKRLYASTLNLATATGIEIVNELVRVSKEFTTGIKGKYEPLIFAVHQDIYYKFLEVYNSDANSDLDSLTVIERKNLFGSIQMVKNLISPTTGEAGAIVLDAKQENYEFKEIIAPRTFEYEIKREIEGGVELKDSEVMAYRPESIMEVTFAGYPA